MSSRYGISGQAEDLYELYQSVEDGDLENILESIHQIEPWQDSDDSTEIVEGFFYSQNDDKKKNLPITLKRF